MLIRIKAPHFVAGVVLKDCPPMCKRCGGVLAPGGCPHRPDLDGGRVITAAPIVGYMMGWTLDRISAYCLRKGWQVT